MPKLKFHSKDNTELVEWEDERRTEPPITKEISLDEIKSCIKHIIHKKCVKLVTGVAGTVCGPSNRDKFIRATGIRIKAKHAKI